MRISDWSSDVCSSDLIGPVKLHRGNTDIQLHTRNAGYAAFLQQMFHFGKAAFDERQRAALCSHKRMPFGYGIGIAVEGKDLRTMVHHRRAIAARAEGAIDMTLARGNGERGQHFIKEDGNM